LPKRAKNEENKEQEIFLAKWEIWMSFRGALMGEVSGGGGGKESTFSE